MKNALRNPYLFNPDNTYLLGRSKLPSASPSSGQLSKSKQVQVKRTSGIAALKKLLQSISRWGYFQLEYYVLAILIVSILLMLGFFLSAMAMWQVLR